MLKKRFYPRWSVDRRTWHCGTQEIKELSRTQGRKSRNRSRRKSRSRSRKRGQEERKLRLWTNRWRAEGHNRIGCIAKWTLIKPTELKRSERRVKIKGCRRMPWWSSGPFETIWNIWSLWHLLRLIGTIWKYLGSFWTNAIRTIVDNFGPFWTFEDHLKSFRKI